MNGIDRILHLLGRVSVPPGYIFPTGADRSSIEKFENEFGIQLPVDLKNWLEISNGPLVGPGGIFGIGNVSNGLSIANHLRLYPAWPARGWIPIAADGCGNYYALDFSGAYKDLHPIIFVEPSIDDLEPAYVVASCLWIFLESLLLREVHESRWPFDREEVVKRDPNILRVIGISLPWEV